MEKKVFGAEDLSVNELNLRMKKVIGASNLSVWELDVVKAEKIAEKKGVTSAGQLSANELLSALELARISIRPEKYQVRRGLLSSGSYLEGSERHLVRRHPSDELECFQRLRQSLQLFSEPSFALRLAIHPLSFEYAQFDTV